VARILWVSTELPDRQGQGGQRRQFHQIRALARRGHDITVVVPASDQRGESLAEFAEVQRPQLTFLGRIVRRRVLRLRRALLGTPADVVVVSHVEAWWLLPTSGTLGTPVLVDVHNVLSHWHLSNGRHDEGDETRAAEALALREAAGVMTCSATETARLQAAHPTEAAKIFAAPLGVDPEEWPPKEFSRAEPVVALFGSWSWEPNELGLRWFLDSVWPLVRAGVPNARALVAGSGVEDAAQWPSGAEFVGRVEDLAAFTARATVVAVPVLRGVGASVKFAESLASGASVVATADGANGLADPPAYVTDRADEWATWIIERLERRADEPAPAPARAVALNDYTWDSAAVPIDDWIAEHTRARATPTVAPSDPESKGPA